MRNLQVINEHIQRHLEILVKKLVKEVLTTYDLDDEIVRHVAMLISEQAFMAVSPFTVKQSEYDEALKQWYTQR